jgi:hypothetical protein
VNYVPVVFIAAIVTSSALFLINKSPEAIINPSISDFILAAV